MREVEKMRKNPLALLWKAEPRDLVIDPLEGGREESRMGPGVLCLATGLMASHLLRWGHGGRGRLETEHVN